MVFWMPTCTVLNEKCVSIMLQPTSISAYASTHLVSYVRLSVAVSVIVPVINFALCRVSFSPFTNLSLFIIVQYSFVSPPAHVHRVYLLTEPEVLSPTGKILNSCNTPTCVPRLFLICFSLPNSLWTRSLLLDFIQQQSPHFHSTHPLSIGPQHGTIPL